MKSVINAKNIIDNPYLPGIFLFLIALLIGLQTYKDYGISWDEPQQRLIGLTSYNYITTGAKDLFTFQDRNYGVAFELPLIYLEKNIFQLQDARDIYLMRHLTTHIFFLISVLAGYILIYNLYKNRLLASLGFLLFLTSPRIYAHSFFNTKDTPFLSMVLITLLFCQIAFDKNKNWSFLLLGIIAGLTTSIRIMGIMLAFFIVIQFIFDIINNLNKKKENKTTLIHLAIFLIFFCIIVYVTFPYLWNDPFNRVVESFQKMSRFNFDGTILLNGTTYRTLELPWFYFPAWFVISNPIIWLIAGATGIFLIVKNVLSNPSKFLNNNIERNFLLHLLTFITPISAVLIFHSVIYDDWRHLYFVYSSFILLSMYSLNQLVNSKYKLLAIGAIMIQLGMIGYFMIQFHPFQEVYFNELVNHNEESLRENFDLDYWGASYKQGLEYLIKNDNKLPIKIACNFNAPVSNNILMLRKEDRDKIKIEDQPHADYFLTEFRGHPEDYPTQYNGHPITIAYSIKVQNSTIMAIYKLRDKN